MAATTPIASATGTDALRFVDDYLASRDLPCWEDHDQRLARLKEAGLVIRGETSFPSIPERGHARLIRAATDVAAARAHGWHNRLLACLDSAKYGMLESENHTVPTTLGALATRLGKDPAEFSHASKRDLTPTIRRWLARAANILQVEPAWLLDGRTATRRAGQHVTLLPVWLTPYADAFRAAWALITQWLQLGTAVIRAADARGVALPSIASPASHWLALLVALHRAGAALPPLPYLPEFPRVYPVVQEAERVEVTITCTRGELTALMRAALEWEETIMPRGGTPSPSLATLREARYRLGTRLWVQQDEFQGDPPPTH